MLSRTFSVLAVFFIIVSVEGLEHIYYKGLILPGCENTLLDKTEHTKSLSLMWCAHMIPICFNRHIISILSISQKHLRKRGEPSILAWAIFMNKYKLPYWLAHIIAFKGNRYITLKYFIFPTSETKHWRNRLEKGLCSLKELSLYNKAMQSIWKRTLTKHIALRLVFLWRWKQSHPLCDSFRHFENCYKLCLPICRNISTAGNLRRTAWTDNTKSFKETFKPSRRLNYFNASRRNALELCGTPLSNTLYKLTCYSSGFPVPNGTSPNFAIPDSLLKIMLLKFCLFNWSHFGTIRMILGS